MERNSGMRTRILGAALAGALLIYGGAPSPAGAMEILEAADHAEIEARIAAGAVTRIALAGDRVKKVVRAPDGLRVEHDPATGDLYLTPSGPEADAAALFVVTEKGFTYRLALTAAEDGSAQLLLRNPAALAAGDGAGPDARVGELVALVRAVARRELPAGYTIAAGTGEANGLAVIETWRGPALAAHVVEGGDVEDATALAARFEGALAAWLAPAGAGPSGRRLGVVVVRGDTR